MLLTSRRKTSAWGAGRGQPLSHRCAERADYAGLVPLGFPRPCLVVSLGLFRVLYGCTSVSRVSERLYLKHKGLVLREIINMFLAPGQQESTSPERERLSSPPPHPPHHLSASWSNSEQGYNSTASLTEMSCDVHMEVGMRLHRCCRVPHSGALEVNWRVFINYDLASSPLLLKNYVIALINCKSWKDFNFEIYM